MNETIDRTKENKTAKKLFLVGPVTEGFFILVLMLMVVLAVIQIAIPNNWISVSNYCTEVFSNFNSTKWFAGEYSQEFVNQIEDCQRRLSSR